MSETLFADLLASYQERERIPLHEIGAAVGMGPVVRSRAVKAGVIQTDGRAGLGGGYVVTRDEAVKIVIAAAIAFAAGLAVISVLRGVAGAGLSPAALAAALPKVP